MVLADATLMLLFIKPSAPVPGNESGVLPDRVNERIDYLLDTLENSHLRILIPAPVLSEILIRSKADVTEVIVKLNKYAVFEIAPFDQMAAIEMAEIAKAELGRKRTDSATTYAKLKFDRQIVAIAKVRKVTTIYSDDAQVAALAKKVGIATIGVADLPLPPAKKTSAELAGQGAFDFPSDLGWS